MENVKQVFQLGDSVYMIDEDYNFFEGTIRNIGFEIDNSITYTTEDVDFCARDINNWVFKSELDRESGLDKYANF